MNQKPCFQINEDFHSVLFGSAMGFFISYSADSPSTVIQKPIIIGADFR